MNNPISRIIDGLRYNTETSEHICTFESAEGPGNFRYEATALFVTPRGRFFLAGYGGPKTRWALPVPDGTASGEGLLPIDADEAQRFAEENADERTIARFFEFEEA